ncbi:MAG: PEP-utilizing enzyme [Candidatus Uhrbacteria bacterium]
MDSKILAQNWKKNWDGGWSVLSCAYLGYQYTKQLADVLGVSLEETIIVSHRGFSACYFLSDKKEKFGTFFAEKARVNPEIIEGWASDLKITTDKILSLIKTLMTQEATEQNFSAFIQAMFDYGVPHRIVKVAVDYLPEELLKKYLDVLTEARVYAEPVYTETENYMRYFADKLSVKLQIKPELILAMSRQQLQDYFLSGNLPSEDLLNEQYENAVLYLKNGEEELISDDKVKEIENNLLGFNSQQLKGQTAFAGKVTGKVRKVFDPKSETVFEEGEILVTGMTRPEYVPLIKKSAGFITDAGGILSHAAISARELQKPCIIGTEKATKVLQDGDLIELDADKGVINILKKV